MLSPLPHPSLWNIEVISSPTITLKMQCMWYCCSNGLSFVCFQLKIYMERLNFFKFTLADTSHSLTFFAPLNEAFDNIPSNIRYQLESSSTSSTNVEAMFKNHASKSIISTIFRRINSPGAEAGNEPLTLSDFNETRSVDTWIPELHVLKYDSDWLNSFWDKTKVKIWGEGRGEVHLFKQARLFGKIR